jgi:protein-disulfide isomerase
MSGKALLAALACAALGVCAAAAPHAGVRRAPPAARDWSRIVVATPEGGFRMGNPRAKVKLVEYGSLGCPHCAHFEAEGARPLIDRYVKSGRVSWEFRAYLIFPTDPAVSMLLYCRPPSSFFPLIQALYATQGQWIGRLRALPQERITRLQGMSITARNLFLVHASGLDAFFRRHGMGDAAIHACLASPAGMARIMAVTERGNREGVPGTPSFFINGVRAEADDWAKLEPLVVQAGG